MPLENFEQIKEEFLALSTEFSALSKVLRLCHNQDERLAIINQVNLLLSKADLLLSEQQGRLRALQSGFRSLGRRQLLAMFDRELPNGH